jgi:hypothetical protein
MRIWRTFAGVVLLRVMRSSTARQRARLRRVITGWGLMRSGATGLHACCMGPESRCC